MEALKWIVDALKKGATDLANDPAGYIGSAARDVLPKPQPLEYDESGRTVIPKTVDQAGARWLMDNFGLLGMTVYHGSPYKFSKFDMSKIGTGEGAQSYGHGLYFAESPNVAQQYADELSSSILVDGRPIYRNNKVVGSTGMRDVDDFLVSHGGDIEAAIKDASDGFPDAVDGLKSLRGRVTAGSDGTLYKVDIPDEVVSRMLAWDAPLNDQSEFIRQAIGRIGEKGREGADVYLNASQRRRYLNMRQGDKDASQALFEAGIPGIKYFDGQSRAGAEGTRNFVLFDDQMPRILEINGQPTGAQPWKAGEYDALIKALRR